MQLTWWLVLGAVCLGKAIIVLIFNALIHYAVAGAQTYPQILWVSLCVLGPGRAENGDNR